MTEVPSFDEMMQPTLNALRELGGKASVNDLEQAIFRRLALPGDVMSKPHGENPSMTEVEYRLYWETEFSDLWESVERAGLLTEVTAA